MPDREAEIHNQIINSEVYMDQIDPTLVVSFEPEAIWQEITEHLVHSDHEDARNLAQWWIHHLKNNDPDNVRDFITACHLMIQDEQVWEVFRLVVVETLFTEMQRISEEQDEADNA